MPQFKVISEYTPSGDQPQAIEKLAEGLENGLRQQVLLGVTGSGKTYTMAKVIEKVQRPTLVLAHNKTLAAQLCEEFREFFPENAVEYFVSYYDYYQPEAYIPHTDTFIEKDAAINAEIERLRHSATAALFERRDVIVVASVSCIYGLGDPIDYANMVISLRLGEFDVLVGINLLREGLDLPEVSMVAILDADKEGFLRSETSLIQTIGRAARNAEGLVVLYADTVTPSMKAAITETERRRKKQDAYNKAHGIVPQTIRKSVRKVLEISHSAEEEKTTARRKLTDAEREATIRRLEKEMKEASKMLEFEYAALLRDQIIELRGQK